MTTPLASSSSRGRGRGRGNTLPAWMTHHGSGQDDGVGGGVDGAAAPSSSSGGEPSASTSDHRRPENPRDDRRRARRVDDDDNDRISSSSGYDQRGYGRDQREWDTRDRVGGGGGYDYDAERNCRRDQSSSHSYHHHHHRDRDRPVDRDRIMSPDIRSRNGATATDHRGQRGLGYDERGGRVEREISWERDRAPGGTGIGRGRGWGRGRNEMNFVRGRSEEVVYDGDRDERFRDGDRGGVYDRDHDGDAADDTISGIGMGRGRGRGRGANINAPAWMTAGSTTGPVGVGLASSNINIDTDGNLGKGNNNDSMEMLLAQARQVQQEITKQENSSRRDGLHNDNHNNTSKSASTTSDAGNVENSKSGEEKEAAERLLQQRQFEQAQEAARKAAEDELRRLEQLREEEEQRQLRALVGDNSDDENKIDAWMDITSDNNNNNIKHKHGSDEENDDNLLFEFETEEEREERLARKRREERRKKLKSMQVVEQTVDANVVDAVVVVDQPRNVAGVIHSELNHGKGHNDDVDRNADAIENIQTDSIQVIQSTAANDGSTSNDSFDMFASDNATPVPTQTSAKINAMTAAITKNNTTNTNAQECDDAEGYYRVTIGEIITLPKESGEDAASAAAAWDDESDRIARFRVLGIVGKGVFSSVIKCVEETTNPSGDANNNAGRVIAMKIIRNNEVMAKAAAKEMRILRMLCHQPTKSKSKNKPPKAESNGENGEADNNNNPEADDEDDDGEERARENHHIVRLLDVDPNIASAKFKDPYSSSVYAAPPPEFRSHCVFLFEFLPYNLREVLSKFGKNVGINLTAVRSYARQLLCALAHLERHRVVHADLKPDNILVSANFSTVKLADFGSAFFETDHDNDPTPYLVSRFYRPPEVILGLEYDRMVDLWSLAVTLGELFTGSVLFPGDTNNDMLVRFMDAMGPLSHKMAKRHALSYTRMGLQPHFEVGITGGTYQLRKQDVDRVTGQPVCRLVNVLSAKADARLAQVLLRASKGGGAAERVDVLTFADFLNRCLALDPARRLSVRDALRHDFFKKKKKRDEAKT